jgi:prevent-host-death family protein
MKTMSYSESRAKYAETLDAVVDDREEVVITRAGHEPVVIVARVPRRRPHRGVSLSLRELTVRRESTRADFSRPVCSCAARRAPRAPR